MLHCLLESIDLYLFDQICIRRFIYSYIIWSEPPLVDIQRGELTWAWSCEITLLVMPKWAILSLHFRRRVFLWAMDSLRPHFPQTAWVRFCSALPSSLCSVMPLQLLVLKGQWLMRATPGIGDGKGNTGKPNLTARTDSSRGPWKCKQLQASKPITRPTGNFRRSPAKFSYKWTKVKNNTNQTKIAEHR